MSRRSGSRPQPPLPDAGELDLDHAERVLAGEATQPLSGASASLCSCERPVVDSNDDEATCVRCGRWTR